MIQPSAIDFIKYIKSELKSTDFQMIGNAFGPLEPGMIRIIFKDKSGNQYVAQGTV